MTRILGLRPEAAAGAGAGLAAGAAGAAFWACASAPDVSAAAATRVDVPSRMLRRLTARSLVSVKPSVGLLVLLSDIQLSTCCTTSENHGVAGFLLTHRNPRWLVEVSTASACRAAGR